LLTASTAISAAPALSRAVSSETVILGGNRVEHGHGATRRVDAAQQRGDPDAGAQRHADRQPGRLHDEAAAIADQRRDEQAAGQRPGLGERAVRQGEQNDRRRTQRRQQIADARFARPDGENALHEQDAQAGRQRADALAADSGAASAIR
jgi:hypothetical protein